MRVDSFSLSISLIVLDTGLVAGLKDCIAPGIMTCTVWNFGDFWDGKDPVTSQVPRISIPIRSLEGTFHFLTQDKNSP